MANRLSNLYVSPHQTHQRDKARSDQVQNSEGGYVFALDCWNRLDRFLILGSEGGSFYASPQKLTADNIKNIAECVRKDGPRVVARIVEISEAGRAPSNDPALFTLAVCVAEGDEETRRAAYANLTRVARIGTHLFHFADFLKVMGKGWGKGLRKAVARWYTEKPNEKLGYQAIKYKQRDGWAHRDLIRLSHPQPENLTQSALFQYMIDGTIKKGVRLPQVRAAASLSDQSSVSSVVNAIVDHNVPREAIPTKFLKDIRVWEALLEDMPIGALVRNLGVMSNIGLLKPTCAATKKVNAMLSDPKRVSRSRIHPMQVLYALKTYGNGGGLRGSLTWSPVASIVDQLDDTFYMAFGNVEPTGKRMLLGIDVSGSMGWSSDGLLTCAEKAAAMAMVTARTEERDSYAIMGFCSQFKDLGITPRMRLDEVLKRTSRMNFGSTDCSLPMQWAEKQGLNFDAFSVYTDNETYAGVIHPFEALKRYRRKTGIAAKLIVVGIVPNRFTIADPSDAGMLDVVGFDAGTPAIISEFVRADIG